MSRKIYDDDILFWKGNQTKLHEFQKFYNDVHTKLRYTIENQSNNKLNLTE